MTFITSDFVLRHPKLDASKNVQILTVSEFDVVARFLETIPTVKSVLSSEIYRINFGFLTEITILPFFQKLEISRVLHIYSFIYSYMPIIRVHVLIPVLCHLLLISIVLSIYAFLSCVPSMFHLFI